MPKGRHRTKVTIHKDSSGTRVTLRKGKTVAINYFDSKTVANRFAARMKRKPNLSTDLWTLIHHKI